MSSRSAWAEKGVVAVVIAVLNNDSRHVLGSLSRSIRALGPQGVSCGWKSSDATARFRASRDSEGDAPRSNIVPRYVTTSSVVSVASKPCRGCDDTRDDTRPKVAQLAVYLTQRMGRIKYSITIECANKHYKHEGGHSRSIKPFYHRAPRQGQSQSSASSTHKRPATPSSRCLWPDSSPVLLVV